MSNVGCNVGEPRVLPWTNRDALPRLGIDWPNISTLSFLSRAPRQCVIVADRHVHKNGGSTLRDVFLEHERHGLGMYLGYQHPSWETQGPMLQKAARQVGAADNSSHVLMVESHFGTVEFAETVLPSLQRLARTLARARQQPCPLVLTTRIREPLDYYLSFYRWAVGFRQRDAPQAYGATFLEWAQWVPNLQSTILETSMAAYSAEYAPKRYRARFGAAGEGTAAWRRLRTLLDNFDVVAPLDRFDFAMVLLHDRTGLPLLLYKRNTPKQKNGYRGTNDDACPDMGACRRLIAQVAPRDHRMWARYQQRFEKRIVRLGEVFAERVQRYTRAVASVQPAWRRANRRQTLCRFQPGTKPLSARPELQKIRCPFGVTPSGRAASPFHIGACASNYASRSFECPWQYEANGSLTDALGCWRPSSGVK